jgi:hypothetical protein
MYSSGNIGVRNWVLLLESRCILSKYKKPNKAIHTLICQYCKNKTPTIFYAKKIIVGGDTLFKGVITHLTLIGPCILVYFYSKTNQMHQFFIFILFCSNTLHVSDGLSVHHQESETVHTAPVICQTDSADCLLAETRWNCKFNFVFVSSIR